MSHVGTVSVVIPTYNRRELVVQAVRSVLYQSYADFSCTVVDNGSTDGTQQAVRSLEDPRVRVLVVENALGGAGARNVGIEASRDARWVAFLDSDDLWAPEKLERQLSCLADNPASRWSATACVDVSPQLTVSHALRLPDEPPVGSPAKLVGSAELVARLEQDNYLPAGNSTVLVSIDLLADTGGYDAALRTCDDWDLWLRLARRSPLTYLDVPLAAYRIWDGQSSNYEHDFLRDAATVRARNFPGNGSLPEGYAARWARDAASRQVVSRQRLRAAGSYLRAAWLGRAPGQLAYSIGALAFPGTTAKRLRRLDAAHRLPEGWEAMVEPWLSRWRGT